MYSIFLSREKFCVLLGELPWAHPVDEPLRDFLLTVPHPDLVPGLGGQAADMGPVRRPAAITALLN